MADSKKLEIFNSANPQYFFAKISEIGPWISRIDWCEGHWCGSTYIVMRLSDISSKTGKKCIFGVFRLFWGLCWTASQPYRLSHVNALRINQFSEKKFWELPILKIWFFFESAILNFFFKIIFLLLSHKN